MKAGLLLNIAKTHLTSRVKQSAVAALGVTFGIGMYIAMMSFMTGLNQMMDDLMLSRAPHVHIYNEIQHDSTTIIGDHYGEDYFTVVHNTKPKAVKPNIKNAVQILKEIQKDERVLSATTNLSAQIFINYGKTPFTATVKGIDVDTELDYFGLGDLIIEGDAQRLKTVNNGVIVGMTMAEKFALKVNDRLSITTPTGANIQMIVVGVFSSGMNMFDNRQTYSTTKTAQRILEQTPDFFTDINIKVKDLSQAKDVAKDYKSRFEYPSEDWETASAEMELGKSIRNMISYAVSFAMLIVAGFGIYNILTMMIYEKMSDIAILKAMGFDGSDVKRIFLAEATIIGFIGGLMGLSLGGGLSFLISNVPFETKALPTIHHFPINWDPKFYILGMTFAVGTTLLAGYLPSRKAAKIDPVEIIRGR